MPLAPPSLANSLGVGGGAHCHDTLPSHMLCERAHLVQGQHGYQALVWAAMGAVLVLWVMPQDQCWPNSSPHQALMAVWPVCRVGPLTQPVWGHCITGVYVLHELQVGE